ncbi:MAG: AbrB/MazE/SpoVT family DNA-binding domain-containing protein [Nanoarchaeota archaeon]
MIIKREMGGKGQVVIPKDIRLMLGLMPKQKVVFEVNGGDVSIKPEQNPQEFLKDFFNVPKKRKKSLTPKEINKIYEESYDLP